MRKSFLVVCGLAGAALIAVACGDEDAVPAPATADAGGSSGASSSGTSGTSSGSTTDGGSEDDGGETITDGGTNIDPDAGDDDAGPDAAVCNALLADAAPIVTSKCSSQIPAFAGGDLVAGTYFLKQVEDLGPINFCKNQFTPVDFEEQLVLTVDGTGTGTAQTATIIGKRKERTATLTLDPPDAATSPLALTTTCPGNGAGKVRYTSALRNQKQVLVLELAYGQGGRALYHFEKQ